MEFAKLLVRQNGKRDRANYAHGRSFTDGDETRPVTCNVREGPCFLSLSLSNRNILFHYIQKAEDGSDV